MSLNNYFKKVCNNLALFYDLYIGAQNIAKLIGGDNYGRRGPEDKRNEAAQT